jgi:hypothetical protein
MGGVVRARGADRAEPSDGVSLPGRVLEELDRSVGGQRAAPARHGVLGCVAGRVEHDPPHSEARHEGGVEGLGELGAQGEVVGERRLGERRHGCHPSLRHLDAAVVAVERRDGEQGVGVGSQRGDEIGGIGEVVEREGDFATGQPVEEGDDVAAVRVEAVRRLAAGRHRVPADEAELAEDGDGGQGQHEQLPPPVGGHRGEGGDQGDGRGDEPQKDGHRPRRAEHTSRGEQRGESEDRTDGGEGAAVEAPVDDGVDPEAGEHGGGDHRHGEPPGRHASLIEQRQVVVGEAVGRRAGPEGGEDTERPQAAQDGREDAPVAPADAVDEPDEGEDAGGGADERQRLVRSRVGVGQARAGVAEEGPQRTAGIEVVRRVAHHAEGAGAAEGAVPGRREGGQQLWGGEQGADGRRRRHVAEPAPRAGVGGDGDGGADGERRQRVHHLRVAGREHEGRHHGGGRRRQPRSGRGDGGVDQGEEERQPRQHEELLELQGLLHDQAAADQGGGRHRGRRGPEA